MISSCRALRGSLAGPLGIHGAVRGNLWEVFKGFVLEVREILSMGFSSLCGFPQAFHGTEMLQEFMADE